IQALQGGFPLMFYAVAAAVVGGTSLFGGSGTIIGAALGVLVLAVLNLGFTLQGISAYWFDFVLGIAIIVSMSFNVTLERIRQAGRLGGSTCPRLRSPRQRVPTPSGSRTSRRASASCVRSRTSRCTSAPEKCWDSSATTARASRPS